MTPPAPATSPQSPPGTATPSREDAPTSLLEAAEAAIGQMSWLQDTDGAAVALALTYARRIDEAVQYADGQEVTKALYLGPHLLNALRALGGAPAERKALGVEESVRGKLAHLRAAR